MTVAVLMGSDSDLERLAPCLDTLRALEIGFEARVLSAHRTPADLIAFVEDAPRRGVRVFVCAAGGAAHLPGMAAAKTLLPVIGVPIQSKALNGLDSLLSIAQMPAGVPVATVAIGEPGARNAALLATAILAARHAPLRDALAAFRERQTAEVLARPDPAAG